MSAPKTFRLHVDPGKCQGHNRCKSIAPDLFQLDEFGNAREAGDGLVPPDQLERAKLAQKNCPEYAIRLGSAT
jgi:ferredoxin